MRTRYLDPISYGNNENKYVEKIAQWLLGGKAVYDPKIIVQMIQNQRLQDRMNTRLMFNKITQMLIAENPSQLDYQCRVPLGFEIY